MDKTCPRKIGHASMKVWVPKNVDKEGKVIVGENTNNFEEVSRSKLDKGKDKVNKMREIENASPPQSSSVNMFSILESVMEENKPSLSD